jgi:Fe2+ or Zn2+ uptake regulation protein
VDVRSPGELVDAFRASGRKVTPQRQRIFELLHGDQSHPTAESVYARLVEDLPSVSLRTVYATLHELAELGDLHELTLGTGSTRFDPNVAPHHHLVCRLCGGVEDLVVDTTGIPLPADNALGFEVEATEIVFRGRCASCASQAAPKATRPESGNP